MLVKLILLCFTQHAKVVGYLLVVLVINNTPIKRVTNVNYLGLRLSNDLSLENTQPPCSTQINDETECLSH